MGKIRTKNNDSKKEVIIQQAAILFRNKSYASSSMRELAEILGVEAPSLYNHIGSKSELLQTICFKVGNRFIEKVNEMEQSNQPVKKRIEILIRFYITMMIENFDEVFVANHEWKHLKEPALADFLNIRRSYEKSFINIVQDGIENGELKSTNAAVTVLTILSAVRGLEFWHNRKNISPDVLENSMVEQLLTGIIQ